MFVRGQHNGGSGGYQDGMSYESSNHRGQSNGSGHNEGDDGQMSNELKECQRKLLEWNARAEEATQLNFVLEQELQAHAAKRMDLERELNDVKRKHKNEMAIQKVNS